MLCLDRTDLAKNHDYASLQNWAHFAIGTKLIFSVRAQIVTHAHSHCHIYISGREAASNCITGFHGLAC